MYPKAAINVECCSPDAGTTEQVIAEDLSYITSIILELFEVEFAYTHDFVVAVLFELAEVYSEMAMLPVSIVGLVC